MLEFTTRKKLSKLDCVTHDPKHAPVFAIIEHFPLALTVETTEILVEVGVFQRGWFALSAIFRSKGTSPTDFFWYQKTRVLRFYVLSK